MNRCLVAAAAAFFVAWMPFWMGITTAIVLLIVGVALTASDPSKKAIGGLLLAFCFTSAAQAQSLRDLPSLKP